MRIILEGCDGTGKTTLAKILADKYGLDICHCTQDDPGDYDFYRQTVRKENVIWDRHTLGELIYPEVFGRKQKISTEDARLIIHNARENDVRIFVLTSNIESIYNRIDARGNEDIRVHDSLAEIDRKFRFYANEFNIPIIDTASMTLGSIFKLVETPQTNKGGFIHG